MTKRESCRRSRIQPNQSNSLTSINDSTEPRRLSKGRARTRASGVKLIQDPKDDDKLLGEQLAKMGLYVTNTIGDGNCLFRALSDQSFGTPTQHNQIRQEVCDYLELNESKYKAFVDIDEEESWERRLIEMRKLGTYGGHLELSAYANLHKTPIKVIQPGMIYLIGFEDESPCTVSSKNLKGKARHVESDASSTTTPLYIVYHQWEHYSSVRNLAGPHSGPPQIRETLRLSSSSPEEDTKFNMTLDPTQLSSQLNLLRKSLPEEVSYTNQELKEMITRTGSWEKTLEEILEEVQGHSSGRSSSSTDQMNSSKITKDLKPTCDSLIRSDYREPTPSSISVTSASSPANSTPPSSISQSSKSQLRKLSRSHSRSPEPNDSADEGIGRRLRRRRTRSNTSSNQSTYLKPPKSSNSLSSCTSKSDSIYSEKLSSPEIQTRLINSMNSKVLIVEKEVIINPKEEVKKTKSIRNKVNPTSTHSPLSKLMSRKEIKQTQKKSNRLDVNVKNVNGNRSIQIGDQNLKDRVETIGLFRELRV